MGFGALHFKKSSNMAKNEENPVQLLKKKILSYRR